MGLGYPEGPGRSFANSFANSNVAATSTVDSGSTSVLSVGLGFDFNAALIKIAMDVGTGYINFKSTVRGSTGDFKVTSGDMMQDFYSFGVGVAGMTLTATSTAALARVGAWG